MRILQFSVHSSQKFHYWSEILYQASNTYNIFKIFISLSTSTILLLRNVLWECIFPMTLNNSFNFNKKVNHHHFFLYFSGWALSVRADLSFFLNVCREHGLWNEEVKGEVPLSAQTAAYFPHLSAVSSPRGNCSYVWEKRSLQVHYTNTVTCSVLYIWSHSKLAYWKLFITSDRRETDMSHMFSLSCANILLWNVLKIVSLCVPDLPKLFCCYHFF